MSEKTCSEAHKYYLIKYSSSYMSQQGSIAAKINQQFQENIKKIGKHQVFLKKIYFLVFSKTLTLKVIEKLRKFVLKTKTKAVLQNQLNQLVLQNTVVYLKNTFLSVYYQPQEISIALQINKVEAATAKGFLLRLKQFNVVFVLQFVGVILECTNKTITFQKLDLIMSSAIKLMDGLKSQPKIKRSEPF